MAFSWRQSVRPQPAGTPPLTSLDARRNRPAARGAYGNPPRRVSSCWTHAFTGRAAEPYINHLIEVAQLVSSALPETDTNLVMAALLHDVVEDTDVSKEDLIQRFG